METRTKDIRKQVGGGGVNRKLEYLFELKVNRKRIKMAVLIKTKTLSTHKTQNRKFTKNVSDKLVFFVFIIAKWGVSEQSSIIRCFSKVKIIKRITQKHKYTFKF